jgi:hypothetical protein
MDRMDAYHARIIRPFFSSIPSHLFISEDIAGANLTLLRSSLEAKHPDDLRIALAAPLERKPSQERYLNGKRLFLFTPPICIEVS